MASLSASILLTLLLSGCGASGGSAPGTDAPGGVSPLLPPTVPLDIPVADLVVDPGPEAGSVILRFTSPGGATEAPANAYRVLGAVRHFDETSLDRASVMPVSASPRPPGSREAVTITGLTPGRTLVFGVRAVRSGQMAPLGLTASGRVAGRGVPPSPANAIRLDGPATLTASGATYLLTRDVTTAGTAFEITGRDVTLDLGGHTVTYGTGGGRAVGVHASDPAGRGTTSILGGRLVQGASGSGGHAVLLESIEGARVSYLSIDVHGPDAHGIWVAEADGTVRIDHCEVACRTRTVSNRHYPGVSAIFVEQMTGALEIDQNLITATPQWGIQVEGRSSSHPCLIHHNRVLGTRALVANGYMIGVHKPDADVYENELRSESRGIHVDEVDTSGRNAWVHDNRVEVQDQPNPEYPDRHWAHGIKVEAANGCRVERNRIGGVADTAHGDVYGLDVTVGEARGITIRHNRVEVVSRTAALEARALNWTYGASGAAPNDVAVWHNVFRATDTLVHHEWDGGRGCFCSENWWHRDLSLGGGHPFRFEYFENGTDIETHEQRFRDPVGTVDVLDVEQWASPGPYSSGRLWSLTVVVRNGSAPVAGADVVVRRRSGATAFSATTDSKGIARGFVLGTQVDRGPTFVTPNPHAITVVAAGLPTWQGSSTIESRTALVVDLSTGTTTEDGAAPPPPPQVAAHALAASRAFVWWTAPEDVSGIAAYLVYLDGKPAGITSELGIYLAGLDADTRHVVTVVSLDGAGRISVASSGVDFTTRPEDRGP